jgi:ferredoxin-NADP reductase
MAAVGGSPGGLSVFLCGPADMVRGLQPAFSAGVPARPIHREHFDLR